VTADLVIVSAGDRGSRPGGRAVTGIAAGFAPVTGRPATPQDPERRPGIAGVVES
jgi:hypothetical protein